MALNVSDFAKKIKNKYPEYKDVDDLELAKKIVEKYPEYKSRVMFDDSVKKKDQSELSPYIAKPTSIVSKEVPKPLQESGTTTNSQVDAVDNYIENADGKLPTDEDFNSSVDKIVSRFTKPVTVEEAGDYDSVKTKAISTLKDVYKKSKEQPVYLNQDFTSSVPYQAQQDATNIPRINPELKELSDKGKLTLSNARKAFKSNYIEENPDVLKKLQSDKEEDVEEANKEIYNAFLKEPEILSGIERTRADRNGLEVAYDAFKEGMDERDFNIKIAQEIAGADDEEAKKLLELEYNRYLEQSQDIQRPQADLISVEGISKMAGTQAMPIVNATIIGLIPAIGRPASILYSSGDAGTTSYGSAFRGTYIQARSEGKSDKEAYDIAKDVAKVNFVTGAIEGALGVKTSGLAKKLGGKFTQKFASKALQPLVDRAASGALDIGLDASAAATGQIVNNWSAISKGLNTDLFDGVEDEMLGEIIFSVGMKGVNIPNHIETVADFKKYVKDLPINEKQKIFNKVVESKEDIDNKISKDRAKDYLNLKGQEALNNNDIETVNKIKETPNDFIEGEIKKLTVIKDALENTEEKQEIQKDIDALKTMAKTDLTAKVTVKEENKESIIDTKDFEAKLQDEAFIEKVANGDIDVSIDNDTELGNRLNEKVEAFKTEQEITKAFEDDSENEAELQSDEQVETTKTNIDETESTGATETNIEGETSKVDETIIGSDTKKRQPKKLKRGLTGKVPLDKRKIKDKEMLSALAIDSKDIEVAVMKYFIGGGKLSSKGLGQLLRGKGEVQARIQMIRKESDGGKTIDEITHEIWESIGGYSKGINSMDIRNVVEDVIKNNNTPKQMALSLNSRYGNKGIQEVDGKRYNNSGEELFETPMGYMTQSDIDDYINYEENLKVVKDEERMAEVMAYYDNITDEELDAIDDVNEEFVEAKMKELSDENKTKIEKADERLKKAKEDFRKSGGLSTGGLQNLEQFVNLIAAYINKGVVEVQDLIDRIRKDFPNESFNPKMVNDALDIINANKNLTVEVAKGNKVSDGLKTVFNDYQTNGGTLSYNEFLKGLKSYISEQKKIKEQAKVEERKAETGATLESKPINKEEKAKKVGLKLGIKTQQDLNKEVADLIKEYMVKGLLNDRQVKALTKRALGVKVGNLKSQTDFANFFNKVMDDVEYVNKRTEASAIISKAKKQAKSKTAFENTENLANKIASIDINYIENIDGLLDVLREYNDDKKVPNVAKLTNDINPFVEESMLGKEEALRQKTFEIAEGLGYGKAALKGLTYAEIKKLLETPTGLEETLSSEEKLQEKKAAMVEANSILRDFLKGLDTTELSAKEKGLLKDLINVDLSELNLGELKSLFLVGNNILTNQSFANAENLAITFKSKHDAKVFLKQVKNSKIILSKAWLNPFRSFQQLIDNIFMNNRVLAAKFTDLIGELNANEGRKIVKDKTDIFIERFNKILNDNKLNTLADRARITAAALGLRYDGYHNMTEEEEFQGNKADINANYENTKNDADFKDELQEAKEAADFINQFKTKKDLEDFLNKKENKGMKDALTFIEKSFAKIAQERVDLSSTMFNSGMKLVDKHYAPKKVITRDKNDADSVNPFEQKYTQISLTPKRAGSAFDANKPGSLGNNRLGLDLLVYGSYEMEKALTEIHLSKATLKAKTILKSKDVQDVLGISTTRLLEEKIKNQYAPQIERSQSSAKLNSVIDFIRKSTTASILSGFSQLIKQSSVIANISSTLPPKQALLFSKELATGLKNFKVATLITPTITKQLVNPIHKMFAIGSRVEMNIGVDRGETARKARKNLLGKQSGFIRMTGKYLGKGHDVITDLLLSPMHVQDIYISTATWNAAYKGYLAENGITDVDMATEHEKIVGDNNEAQIRREAAAYAEHMVGITQIPSDAAQRAEIMKDGNMSSKLLRIITTPFNNFGINSLVRKVDAVKGLVNKEGKVQSAKDLVGLVAEAAAFQYTKYALAIHVFPKLASITYAALTGEDEDDVDELVKVDKEYAEKVIDRSLDALYVDLVLQGTPEAAKELTVSLLNAINYNFKKENGLIDDSISFSDWQKEGGGLSQFKKDDDYLIQSYGLLGIMPTKLSNSYTSTKLRREGIVEGFMGKDKKVKLADKDKRVMQVIEVIEYLNAMGLSGADLSNISSKIKKGVLDKHKGKKGAKKKVIKPIS